MKVTITIPPVNRNEHLCRGRTLVVQRAGKKPEEIPVGGPTVTFEADYFTKVQVELINQYGPSIGDRLEQACARFVVGGEVKPSEIGIAFAE